MLVHEGRTLVRSLLAVVVVLIDVFQQVEPCCVSNAQVQETLHHVELADSLAVVHQILANLLTGLFGTFASHLDKGEYHQCQTTLKLAARLLQLHHLLRHLLSVECLHCGHRGLLYLLFYLHILNVKRVQRYE